MARWKIVEDSDGEDEEPNSPVLPAISILKDVRPSNVTDTQSSPDAVASKILESINPSTESTEVLNRDIRRAHESLVEPTSECNRSSRKPFSLSQQPTNSPKASNQKRKRALSNVESPSPRIKKAVKRQSSKEGCDPFEFRGSSDGEIEATRHIRSSRERVGRRREGASNDDDDVIGRRIDQGPTISMGSSEIPASLNSNEIIESLEAPLEVQRLHTPTLSSRGIERSNTISSDEHVQIDLRSSTIAALQALPPSDPKQEKSSSAHSISPSEIITVGSAVTQFREEDIEGNHIPPSFDERTIGTLNPIVLLPQPVQKSELPNQTTCETQDRRNGDIEPEKSRKQEDIGENIADDLGSDDNAIGIPKELYRPRPSRSRTGRGAGELVAPIDFSKRPEAIAKAIVKPKRKRKIRKTKDDEEEDLEMDDTKRPDVEVKKVEVLQAQPDESSEDDRSVLSVAKDVRTDSKNTGQKPKKQRGRPKKDIEAEEDGPSPTIFRTRSLNATKTGQKVGKIVEAAADNMGEEDENQDDRCDEEGAVTANDAVNKVLEESTGNAIKIQGPEDSSKQAPSYKDQPETPETPKKHVKTADKGPDKHSPISSGKVAYRVGLSKRARIEPLLRIVRK